MAFDKSCPGSRTIREPVPESMECPQCGTEVEIWTDELKATCPKCGGKVYRAQQASCIDWCPHALECVGPEAYERLRPGLNDDLAEGDSPLTALEKEHERAVETLGLLRGAAFCLKMSLNNTETPLRERGIDHLDKVLGFFDHDLRLHFRREEEVLFPAVEKYIGTEKSPTRLLLGEHQELWTYYEKLKKALDKIRDNETETTEEDIDLATGTGADIERFLKDHIRKEDESLFPLARKLIPEKELEEFPARFKAVVVPEAEAADEQAADGSENIDTSTPTGLLKAEHQAVLGKLLQMEKLFDNLEQREEVADPLKELAAFFETDFWLHFDKEERALFPEFDDFMPRGAGPLAAMMDEHDVLRQTNADLQQALDHYFKDKDYTEAIPKIRRYGQHFIETLRGHIQKEDGILFSMADMHLKPEQNEKVMRLFSEMEPAG